MYRHDIWISFKIDVDEKNAPPTIDLKGQNIVEKEENQKV